MFTIKTKILCIFFDEKSCQFRKKPYFCTRIWDGSSVGLERMLDRHEVTSSILVRPTQRRCKASFVSTEGR